MGDNEDRQDGIGITLAKRALKYYKSIGIVTIASVTAIFIIGIIFLIILTSSQKIPDLEKLKKSTYMSLEPTALALKEIPSDQMEIFREGQKNYNIPWTVLAAVSKNRTKFGKEIYRNTYGVFGLDSVWWSGPGSKKYSLDPEGNIANKGNGKNEYDIPDNLDDIDAAYAACEQPRPYPNPPGTLWTRSDAYWSEPSPPANTTSSTAGTSSNTTVSANNTSSTPVVRLASTTSTSTSGTSSKPKPCNIPAPVYTADPKDDRDATMAVAKYLVDHNFSEDPRGALQDLLGRRVVANIVIIQATKYGVLVDASTLPNMSFEDNQIPAKYIPIYQAAAEKFNVPWTLLAAHHRVETRFSTHRPMVSSAGAEGHMQFMPCTWVGWSAPGCKGSNGKGDIPSADKTSPEAISRYGGYGLDANGDGKADMWNIEDAIYSAASYLSRNGASSGDLRKAIYAYNHSETYIQNVLYFKNTYDNGYVAVDENSGFNGTSNPYIIWPVDQSKSTLSSPYYYRFHPVDLVYKWHRGIDIARSNRSAPSPSIMAIADGRVVWSDVGFAGSGYGGLGNSVAIDHGNGIYSLYAHMVPGSVRVQAGQNVRQGDILGTMGMSGKVSGIHLHFEIHIGSPKHIEGSTMFLNPQCVYKALSGNQSGDWRSTLNSLGADRLQKC